ncbi:MAG: hypothetical protein A2075_15885 [Geobacteraceae bacterium GWC2_58_44]|nr:MAG: hypothetical protein A2075_15885 [Geobacteraceae bacterium GWC2_58_44]HBG04206.1 hypothetical protein [Geobacter sp.]
MRKPRLFKALLLAFLALTLTGCSITHVVRVEDREKIDLRTMIAELSGTPLVFAGERHDAASHHRLQLDILQAIRAEGKPLAIGMEMFENSSQPALDAWSAGKAPEFAIRKVFEANWRNISWGLYRDILLFARDNNIPIVALNAPRSMVRKVSQTGFSSLTSEELRLLPAGLDGKVSDAYLDFIKSSYYMHGRKGDAFRYMCEAQMLRNRVMARRIGDYFLLHPETVMVVIAGGGHARKMGGIPVELEKIPYKIVLPPVPTLTSERVTTNDADYLMEEPFSWLAEIF